MVKPDHLIIITFTDDKEYLFTEILPLHLAECDLIDL